MSHLDSKLPAHEAGFLFLSAQRARSLDRLFISALALALIVALSACSSVAPTVIPAEPPADEAADLAADEPEPSSRSYTDSLGRTVTISERPEAIISLAPSVAETLFAIGAGPQVVGRTEFDNYPPEVESLPTVGGFSTSTISIETILDLEPDLVVAGARSQAEIIPVLEEAGITVFVSEPASLEEIQNAILTLGEMTGNQERAESVVDDMKARMAIVSDKVGDRPADERVTVFYEIWHEPLTSATNETFLGELITLAGGTNIFGDLEGEYPTISAEEIIESDPDIILGPSSHGDQLTAETIAARPGWGDLSAVQAGAIYIVDGDVISRPGPRIIDALEAIAAHFYPEQFE